MIPAFISVISSHALASSVRDDRRLKCWCSAVFDIRCPACRSESNRMKGAALVAPLTTGGPSLAALFLGALRPVLVSKADPARAIAQQKYMKTSMPFYGVAVAEVRKATLALLKGPRREDYAPETQQAYNEAVVGIFTGATHREEWYAGVDYALHFPRFICLDSIAHYRTVTELTQWWDIVDFMGYKLIGGALRGQSREVLRGHIQELLSSDNLWVRRTAVLAQLKYKDKTDTEILSQTLEVVMDERGFFIEKAVGWALREYSYTDANWVRSFIEKYKERLARLSVREGLKVIGDNAGSGSRKKQKTL